MKQRLNEAAIANELRGGSAFFRRGQEAASMATEAGTTSHPAVEREKASGRTSVRPDERAVSRRTIKRHPFEFFQDQLDALKRFALEEQMAGRAGNMSDMVRQALDSYIARRHSKQESA